MEPTTETAQERTNVLASFLVPHVLLNLPEINDTPEVRRIKSRANGAWLKKWLPTYIGRWIVIFLVLLTMASVAVAMGLPDILNWALEFAEYVSGGFALGLTYMYFLGRSGQES